MEKNVKKISSWGVYGKKKPWHVNVMWRYFFAFICNIYYSAFDCTKCPKAIRRYNHIIMNFIINTFSFEKIIDFNGNDDDDLYHIQRNNNNHNKIDMINIYAPREFDRPIYLFRNEMIKHAGSLFDSAFTF